MTDSDTVTRVRTVEGKVNYAVDNGGVNRFHAKDSSLDNFSYDPRTVSITDGRTLGDQPNLEREGFALLRMPSAVEDFRNLDRVMAIHPGEITAFIAGVTQADEVVVAGPPALRFGDRATARDRAAHSKTARLIHSDTYETASNTFTAQYNPHPERRIARCEHHNIWRTFSRPPQDLPLALCDFRSVSPDDIIRAEAAFDNDQGEVTWTFEAMIFRYDPAHRWVFFSDMTRDEVLVFKRHDMDRSHPWFVPHTAFEDPSAPADAEPRASIEIRTISYWYE
jgi:hypothetical protein